MVHASRESEQAVERRRGAAPPVPAKDELVQVTLQVRLTHAVQRAHQPPLEVGEGAVDLRQQHMARHDADGARPVVVPVELPVAGQPVGDNSRTPRHCSLHEGADVLAFLALERRQT